MIALAMTEDCRSGVPGGIVNGHAIPERVDHLEQMAGRRTDQRHLVESAVILYRAGDQKKSSIYEMYHILSGAGELTESLDPKLIRLTT